MVAMASLLEEGVEFDSFEAFHLVLQKYEDDNFVQFIRSSSSRVEKQQGNTLNRTINPKIKYSRIQYRCFYGPYKLNPSNKPLGVRKSSSKKTDCPVRLRVCMTPDGQRLCIKQSVLDAHNHEVSEELYKSLGVQKQLDEETELEIYNLISMHEDKRMARMLIRDKLTAETGKAVSSQDISNIENRVRKRLDREKAAAARSDDEDEDGDFSDDDDFDGSNDDNEENRENKTNRLNVEKESAEESKSISKGASPTSLLKRPQRNRREPARLREDFEVSSNSVRTLIPAEEVEGLRGEIAQAATSTAKISSQGQGRGRKRKLQGPSDPFEDEEYAEELLEIERRKLEIREKLLEIEKKKMQMLSDILKKLDKVLENQHKS